ncbi:patatin-like phospholipase family protein [Kineosporia sp. NBRC 101731]|uniref:patatin-like phospholipase family protein n=1 Tax=Kineosporia sp. NBRC 101731 TaxID=3032199 RepID=UPI0024A366C3|nr:patatin-like phospholipase family protein [Kineosporia sp. NBRC 101731]GLY32452.1 hypothetical protein Kisp02_58170 [Kineosporia sp. NBRC 101731]
MTKALVLGAGGPLGIAWQSGLISELGSRGADLSTADFVLGSSAGSVVGATLAAGRDPRGLVEHVSVPLPVPGGGAGDIFAELSGLAAGRPDNPLAAIIDHAFAADTVDEAAWVKQSLFASLAGVPWPAAFHCVAVDTTTSSLHVFHAGSGADLPSVLAASCAVPGMFPPVTLNAGPHIDGGLFSPLNAQLAVGHDQIVVISCFPLTDLPAEMAPVAQGQLSEVEHLRNNGSQVRLIDPDQEFREISEWGAAVMDSSRAARAFEAGVNQAGRLDLEGLY